LTTSLNITYQKKNIQNFPLVMCLREIILLKFPLLPHTMPKKSIEKILMELSDHLALEIDLLPMDRRENIRFQASIMWVVNLEKDLNIQSD